MAEFRYSIIKNPEIFMEKRLQAHSDHAYYRSEESAQAGCSDFRESLNGIWKFSYAKNISSATQALRKRTTIAGLGMISEWPGTYSDGRI